MLYFGNKGHLCLTIRPIKEINAFHKDQTTNLLKKHLRHNFTKKKHEKYIEFLKAFPSIQYWCKDEERMNIKVGVIN